MWKSIGKFLVKCFVNTFNFIKNQLMKLDDIFMENNGGYSFMRVSSSFVVGAILYHYIKSGQNMGLYEYLTLTSVILGKVTHKAFELAGDTRRFDEEDP